LWAAKKSAILNAVTIAKSGGINGLVFRPKAQRKRKEACFQRDENKILAFRSLRTKGLNAEHGVADGSFQQYVCARVYMRTRAAAAPTAQPVSSWLVTR
jgi:hypothetical protein